MENVRKFVPEEEDQKIDLYTYWKVFWRKKLYLAVPLVLSVAISVVGVRYLTPIYESSALVSVEEQNILSGTMRRYIAPIEEEQRTRSRQFRAMIEARLKSREFLEMVVSDLGLHRSYRLREGLEANASRQEGLSQEELTMRHLTGLLEEKIYVETTIPGFYRISVLDSDPGTAYVLATKIGEKYIETTQQAKLQGLRQAGAFSDEQLAIYKEKLEESEKELERVRRELSLTDIETNPVNAANVQLAEARKNSLAARRGRSEIGLRNVRERATEVFEMVPSSETVMEDETIRNIERQLLADSEEMFLMELRGGDQLDEELASSDPLWQELRARISDIVREEYGEFSIDVRPLITEYYFQRIQAGVLRSLERTITGYIEQYRSNVSRRPQLISEENRLVHEVETNRAIYEAFLESKTSAQITEAIQSTNLGVRISIVENAEKPISPVKPNRMKIILLSVMFGTVCGLGAILVTEYMDDSFRSVEEVQRVLSVPVLGTIPKTVAHFAWERRKRGKMIVAWIIGLFIFVAMVSGALYMYARALQGTSIGVELREDLIGRQ